MFKIYFKNCEKVNEKKKNGKSTLLDYFVREKYIISLLYHHQDRSSCNARIFKYVNILIKF